ncbi:hypothetical protein HOP50_02g14030 [Chloropicon primus]|nr:hypothetical protein HOP50_02g14030 [Chloropicon primus]
MECVVQVRVEAVDRNGKAIVRRSIPVSFRPRRSCFKNATVLDVKKAVRGILGVPVKDQELRGPLPSDDVLRDDARLVEHRVVPGVISQAHSNVSAGELFTTVNVSTARTRLQLSSEVSSSSDVLVLTTRHPLREYILSDGFFYTRIKNPCFRLVVILVFLLAGLAATCALGYWLWNVGKLSLPKPKVWLNIEKRIIKFMLLEDLDTDIPPEIREKLEKLEL